MRIRILFFLLLFTQICNAQSITVSNKNKQIFEPVKNTFKYLNKQLDTSNIIYVATIKLSCIKNTLDLQDMFAEIKSKANAIGANAFKLHSYDKGKNSLNCNIILDVYYANDSILKINTSMHDKNKVYLFSSPGHKIINLEEKILLNDSIVICYPNKYRVFELQPNQSITITKKGLLKGYPVNVSYKEQAPSSFYSLYAPKNYDNNDLGMTGLTIKVSSNNIVEVNRNFGYFMTEIFEQTKD
jgi:hypothetical protein